MKVLISAYRCNPNQGGEPYRTITWIRNYLKAGIEVVCLTNSWDKTDLQKIKEEFSGCTFEFLEIPEVINKMYVNKLGVYVHYLAWQYYASKKAMQLHKDCKFDFVHHTCYGSLQLGSGMWRLGIPFVMGPMGGGQFPSPAFKKYFYDGWKEEVLRRLISKFLLLLNPNVRKGLKKSTVVITENFETKDLAFKYGARNIKLFLDSEIPSKTSENIKRSSSEKLRILWVGRLLPRKGLPLALEAIELLNKKDIDFKLTIIGDGPMRDYLTDWFKNSKANNKVEWTGQIAWTDLEEHYLNNDVLLFTSLRDSSGAQLLEAMNYGMPIVTLDQFGARALLPENTCIKVPVTTPEIAISGIADSLEFYFKNPEIRLTHGLNAKEYIQTIYAKNIPDLIDELQDTIKKSKPVII